MGKRSGKTIISKRESKVGRTDRSQTQRRGAKRTDEVSGSLNWDARYGNLKKYRRQCAIAHKAVKHFCCVCLTNTSEQLHHAKYGNDKIGVTVFPVCLDCHANVCHSSINWIKDKQNPLWNNQNTPEFIERLEIGYKLLYGGIE
jgi:hypothetical protein